MSSQHFTKAALMTLMVVIVGIAAWELYWRNRGFEITYNDDVALWAVQRQNLYKPKSEATVFIGSSRIKFDVDLPTWREMTGEETVQLALVGTSPRKMLENLAQDKKFKGKVLMDMTEGLFYATVPWVNASANEAIKYYETYSPTQKASAYLNHKMESAFVFLEEKRFGLNALLEDMPLPPRKNVFVEPPFPKEFEWTTYDRQTYMAPAFVADTNLHKRQIEIWKGFGALDRSPGVGGDTLQRIFKELKNNIDKIRARGGEVAFIRPPSSGPWLEAESFVYPRKKYWDDLLTYTRSSGVHFQDYPETSAFICPEWSHLTRSDAKIYTRHLVKILEEKGWQFKSKTKNIAYQH